MYYINIGGLVDRLFDFGFNFVGSITYLAYGSAQGNTRKDLLYDVNEVYQFADFSFANYFGLFFRGRNIRQVGRVRL